MRSGLILLVCLPAVVCGFVAAAPQNPSLSVGAAAKQLVLVERGISRMPIIITQDSPPETVRAADDLAGYIEKISGARPKVIKWAAGRTPQRAIWVGSQPLLPQLFSKLDFDFQKPEEVLIAADENHLVIAGRDRMAGDIQTEHGTANAVYTFLEKHLGVRWLWPGPLGEDIERRETIAIAPFEYRFHPLFRQRGVYLRLERSGAPLQ